MSAPTKADQDKALEALGYPRGRANTFATIEYARVQAVAQALADERERAVEAIRDSWHEQCAGNRNEDACESCRAYADAIRGLGGEP